MSYKLVPLNIVLFKLQSFFAYISCVDELDFCGNSNTQNSERA